MLQQEKIENEIARLGDLSYVELIDRWTKTHGTRPPVGVKRRLLERSASFDIQAKACGGLPIGSKKALRAAMKLVEAKRLALEASLRKAGEMGASDELLGQSQPKRVKDRPQLLAGTRLLREWNGRQYFVDVRDDGFVFGGNTFRSLSSIARKITGVQWSGPRFFGL